MKPRSDRWRSHWLFGQLPSTLWRTIDWLPPPYEYEYLKKPIDILFGNAALRNRLALPQGVDASEVLHLKVSTKRVGDKRSIPRFFIVDRGSVGTGEQLATCAPVCVASLRIPSVFDEMQFLNR